MMAWLVFSAAHRVWPLVMSAAACSSALAAALGRGFFVAASKLPLLGGGGPQEQDA